MAPCDTPAALAICAMVMVREKSGFLRGDSSSPVGSPRPSDSASLGEFMGLNIAETKGCLQEQKPVADKKIRIPRDPGWFSLKQLGLREDFFFQPLDPLRSKIARGINTLSLEIMTEGGANVVSFLQVFGTAQSPDKVGSHGGKVGAKLVQFTIIGERL